MTRRRSGPASGRYARTRFARAGGFDAERYPLPSVEDIDLGTRLSRSGGRILLDPLIQGTHLKRWTLQDMVRTDFWQRGVPWVELVLRHGSGSTALNLGWRHRVSAAAAVISALALLRGRPGTALAGLIALVALNVELYELFLRRHGPAGVVTGAGLHAVHHVTGALAVPVGRGQASQERLDGDPLPDHRARAR